MKSCLEGKGVIEGDRALWRPRIDGEGVSMLSGSQWVIWDDRKDRNAGKDVLFNEWSLTQCERATTCCLQPQTWDDNASKLHGGTTVKDKGARHGRVKHRRRSSDDE